MIVWVLFGVSIFIVAGTYFIYPLTLKFLNSIDSRSIQKEEIRPFVSIIVAACNEEKRIGKKLQNLSELEYDNNLLEIIIVSDGSTDQTVPIINDFKELSLNLEVVELSQRRGKESAQKKGISMAKGDILVFTDVATMMEKQAIYNIVRYFADEKVGCISSVDKMVNENGEPGGEGLYVRYEMWLRREESRFNSLIGLSGSLFAARREVCENISTQYPSDFGILINSVKMSRIGVQADDVYGFYPELKDTSREFNRKVRTVVRGLAVFFSNIDLLNPIQYGVFSVQLIFHKLLRWLVPFALIGIGLSSLLLVNYSSEFKILLFLQILFYVMALLGYLLPQWRFKIPIKIPYYFVMTNSSILVAWIKYLRGERIVLWQPSER